MSGMCSVRIESVDARLVPEPQETLRLRVKQAAAATQRILKTAVQSHCAGARPATAEAGLIDQRRGQVSTFSPLCYALDVAPSTNYTALSRLPSAREAARWGTES
jgi:hypothetical protein